MILSKDDSDSIRAQEIGGKRRPEVLDLTYTIDSLREELAALKSDSKIQIAAAALDMRDRCTIEAFKAYRVGNGDLQQAASTAANNIRALPLPADAQQLLDKLAADAVHAERERGSDEHQQN